MRSTDNTRETRISSARSNAEAALVRRWSDAAINDSRSLGESIRETLTGAIIDRDLPAGWRLREEELAAIFQVSRTPVREALAALANSHLARRDSRGSLRVESITPDQILQVYAVRRSLEGLAAALAAEAATPRVIQELKRLNSACEEAATEENHQKFAAANVLFHEAIARSTENELLIRFLAEIQTWIKRFPTTTLARPGRPARALSEHREIIDAIEHRDPERAERVAEAHMREGEKIRIEMLAMASRNDD